jgi:hypothetical protein
VGRWCLGHQDETQQKETTSRSTHDVLTPTCHCRHYSQNLKDMNERFSEGF